MAKTVLSIQGGWVPSLVGELGPTCHNKLQPKSPHAATKTQCSQINKWAYFLEWFHSDTGFGKQWPLLGSTQGQALMLILLQCFQGTGMPEP